MLNKRGILLTNVFAIKLPDLEIKKRVVNRNLKFSKLDEYDYDWDIEIVNDRLTENRNNLMEV